VIFEKKRREYSEIMTVHGLERGEVGYSLIGISIKVLVKISEYL